MGPPPSSPDKKASRLVGATSGSVKGAARAVIGALEETGVAKIDRSGKVKIKKLGVAKAVLRPRKTLTGALRSATTRVIDPGKPSTSRAARRVGAQKPNAATSSPRVCEIDALGEQCGVTAIGRCSACGRPFCMSHQARGSNAPTSETIAYADQCSKCLDERVRARACQASSSPISSPMAKEEDPGR